MEKICIVKRRKPTHEGSSSPEAGPATRIHPPSLSVELTAGQADMVRSTSYFRRLYPDSSAPIFLNLHFNEGGLQRMFKAREVCDLLQVSRHTIDRLVRTGHIKSLRIGRLRRFCVEDVMDYLAGCLATGNLRSLDRDNAGDYQRSFENPGE